MESTMFQRPGQMQRIGDRERIASVAGGGLLAGLSFVSGKEARIPLLVAGGLLIARGVSGYSLLYRVLNVYRARDRFTSGIRVERAVTINRPVEEVYAFWRQLENLPRFMENLKSVTVRDDGVSHWVAEAPLGVSVEWDAVVEEDQPGSKIAWRALPGSQIANAGVVMFQPAPGNRGTELRVHMEYKAPGGSFGAALAKIFGNEPDVQVREDLRRLKMLLETGQIITVKGQSSGRGLQKFGW